MYQNALPFMAEYSIVGVYHILVIYSRIDTFGLFLPLGYSYALNFKNSCNNIMR